MNSSTAISTGIFAVTNDLPQLETGVTSYNLDLVRLLGKKFPAVKFVIYLSETNATRFENIRSNNVEIEIVPRFERRRIRGVDRLFQKNQEWKFFSKIDSLRSHKLVIYSVYGLFQYFPAYLSNEIGGRCISVIHDIRFLSHTRRGLVNFIAKKLDYSKCESLVKCSELVLLPSTHSMETLNNLIPSKKYRVSCSVPDSADLEAVSPNLDYWGSPGFFYFPATVVETKNHLILIKAMKLIVRYYPDVRLILSGSNFESSLGRKIQTEIFAEKLERNVTHLGFVSEAEKLWLYESAIAAIFPTKNESFNLGIWEAFAVGCPVITSTDPEMIEQVGNAAVIAELDDAVALFKAMKSLLEKPAISESLSALGKERFALVSRKALLSGWETKIEH